MTLLPLSPQPWAVCLSRSNLARFCRSWWALWWGYWQWQMPEANTLSFLNVFSLPPKKEKSTNTKCILRENTECKTGHIYFSWLQLKPQIPFKRARPQFNITLLHNESQNVTDCLQIPSFFLMPQNLIFLLQICHLHYPRCCPASNTSVGNARMWCQYWQMYPWAVCLVQSGGEGYRGLTGSLPSNSLEAIHPTLESSHARQHKQICISHKPKTR